MYNRTVYNLVGEINDKQEREGKKRDGKKQRKKRSVNKERQVKQNNRSSPNILPMDRTIDKSKKNIKSLVQAKGKEYKQIEMVFQ